MIGYVVNHSGPTGNILNIAWLAVEYCTDFDGPQKMNVNKDEKS